MRIVVGDITLKKPQSGDRDKSFAQAQHRIGGGVKRGLLLVIWVTKITDEIDKITEK